MSTICKSMLRLVTLKSSTQHSVTRCCLENQSLLSQTPLLRRFGHTVRIILKEDIPNGKGFRGDVINVKAGYARNYLVPQKMAVYATEENFKRMQIIDPLTDSKIDDVKTISTEDAEPTSEEWKDAERLRKYLDNKILKIWRNADNAGKCYPGMVDAKAVRTKLSKQLKIDLEDHERVQICSSSVSFSDLHEDAYLDEHLFDDGGNDEEAKNVQLRELGDYLARIHLAGGYSVPLRFTVIKR